jgi:5-methylcytosine-specific restriction endonuclease McrA
MKDITFDHITPISRGGFDLLENYQLVHFECNLAKGQMTQEEFTFLQKGGLLVE